MPSGYEISLAGVDDEEGRFGRQVLGEGWVLAPRRGSVEIRDGHLHWTAEPTARCPVLPRLLDDFLRLGSATAGENDIVDFAVSWGGLALCPEHGLPAGHSLEPLRLLASEPRGYCEWDSLEHREPVASWWRFARQAHALINIAAKLHQGEHGQASDWLVLHDNWIGDDRTRDFIDRAFLHPTELPQGILSSRLAVECTGFADIIQEWLEYGAVRPTFLWLTRYRATPLVQLAARGLFSNLAVQLVWAASAQRGITLCTGCGNAYSPARRPRAREAHYCRPCRDRKVPRKEAKARYQRRKRVEARRAAGRSWAAIASELGMAPIDVKALLTAKRPRRARKL